MTAAISWLQICTCIYVYIYTYIIYIQYIYIPYHTNYHSRYITIFHSTCCHNVSGMKRGKFKHIDHFLFWLILCNIDFSFKSQKGDHQSPEWADWIFQATHNKWLERISKRKEERSKYGRLFKLFKLVLNPHYAWWGKGKWMELEDKVDA